MPDLRGVGTRVGHDLVGGTGAAAAPDLAHPLVQEGILSPAVPLQQRVEPLALGIVTPGAVPHGALDRHLGCLPRRRDVAQGIRRSRLAQARRETVPGVALVRPDIADEGD